MVYNDQQEVEVEVESDELIQYPPCTCEVEANPVIGYCPSCEARMDEERA
jgi:hypothetical protein